MKKEDCVHKNGLFWANMVLTAFSFVRTAYHLRHICSILPYGGFDALFLLLALLPYFLAMGAALLLLLVSLKTGRRLHAGIAAVMQILAPIPWMLLFLKFHYASTSFEVMMLVCSGAGVFLLLTLPAVRPTKNGM